MIQTIEREGPPPMFFELSSDGDLWDHLYKAVKANGARAAKVSWIKGHAKQEHIDKGRSNATNKVGNDKADIIADQGVDLHGKDLIKTASVFHKRHCDYIRFIEK